MNNESTQKQNDVKKEEIVKTPVLPTPTPQPKTPSVGAEITEGFNLLPSMSDEEKVVQKTKSTVSIGSVLSLIILVVIILVVVGFNIVTKQVLNSRKEVLYSIENSVNQQIDKIVSNEEIVDRAVLYSNVKKGAFSHKAIIEFLNEISNKVGNIEMKSVTISEDLKFSFVGYATDLEKVSKLWYMFGIDENIQSINLQSVGKRENNVTFTFEGELKGEKFFNK
ncbi:MAG: hypothetical protein RBT33_04125 [Candidatus Dojkabacteria bacterium]|jgi:hypothetical protein|nr:hypothetical protein [Candidatus Dojkabacteria bacterium]